MAPASIPARVLARTRDWLRADAAVETRADATGYSGATVSNALSGLGGSRDSGATARPNLDREYLSEEELVALLRGSVYRRIIELEPKWATMRGWSITDDSGDVKPLHQEMRRINLRQVIRDADTWGRALGEARVLLVTDDMDRLDRPLDISRVKKLHRLEVLDRREFSPVTFQGDVSQGELGQPEIFEITPRRPGASFQGRVHASRLLRFYGDDLPPSERGYAWTWGADAVGQTLWDGVRHLAQAGASAAKAGQELSVAVFKMATGPAQTAGDQRVEFLDKIRGLNLMKSVANAVFLRPTDSYERVNVNAAGFKDLSEHARLELALLTGIPLALLFGEAPAGLSTDGASWQAAWHATIAAHQEDRYRGPLETIIQVLYQTERGGVPEQWALDFEPLAQLTAKERADVRLVHVQADSSAILDGVITAEEARSRYTQPGGFAVDLQVLDQRKAPEPKVDPAAEEAAARMVEEALAKRAQQPPAADRSDATDDFRGKAFRVPPGARGNARKVLGWREEHGKDVAGMTATGWRRARQLAESETVTGQDLIEIAAWFARHGADESTRAVAEEHKDEPWRDAGYVSWLGWGGDTMRAYAAERVASSRTDATEGAIWIGCVLPEPARLTWAEARSAVEVVTGPLLDPGEAPHVTVLYMGVVDPSAVAEVVEVARLVAQRTDPSEAEAEHARTFAPSEGSGGKWPVVLDVGGAWGLYDIHHQLLRRLAHLVTARQFPDFRAHLTLGYAESLTPEQQAQLAEVEIPESEWMIGGLEVRLGGKTLATLSLAGRRDRKDGARV